MACATGGGGCHGAWQTGAVPANPAGLHSFAGHELCAPVALASGASQQSQSQVLLVNPGCQLQPLYLDLHETACLYKTVEQAQCFLKHLTQALKAQVAALQVLDKLDLNDGTVQHVVLASIPPQEIVPAEVRASHQCLHVLSCLSTSLAVVDYHW